VRKFWRHVPRLRGLLVEGCIQLTTLLLLVGSGYLTFQVRRRGRVLLMREHEQVMESLEAYRMELQRRRNYYRGAWRWSWWPPVPATAVIFAGGVCVLASLLGTWIYARKGKDFQRELDALTTSDGE
jgi:hypothetical protein